jgi:hypothetical protein
MNIPLEHHEPTVTESVRRPHAEWQETEETQDGNSQEEEAIEKNASQEEVAIVFHYPFRLVVG